MKIPGNKGGVRREIWAIKDEGIRGLAWSREVALHSISLGHEVEKQQLPPEGNAAVQKIESDLYKLTQKHLRNRLLNEKSHL